MKILFVTSEVLPFSKTGGLADVSSALPKKLNEFDDVSVRVITPYYKKISSFHDKFKFVGSTTINIAGFTTVCHYFSYFFNNVEYIFIQNEHCFERDNYYGYDDDAIRFTLFQFAALDYIKVGEFIPSIIHLNDWQSGMIPFLLDKHYRYKEEYKYIHTLLSIHNLEYQGNFDSYVSRYFNTFFDYSYIHFDRVNFLKAGIACASAVNTVSPTYRNETLTKEYSFSLDGILSFRKDKYVGILNGIDNTYFDPFTDKAIYFNYGVDNLTEGKLKNKVKLLEEFSFGNKNFPLYVYIGRFASQKGCNLFYSILENILENNNINMFFLGSGDKDFENFLSYLSAKFPTKFKKNIGYDEDLAHKLYAAGDFLLMPSRFEPCGLSQMISFRYGTIPIVRETGGLKDTVVPYNKYLNTGYGFTFSNSESEELKDKIIESYLLFNSKQSDNINDMKKRIMQLDYSQTRMANQYLEIYKKIVKG